MELENSQNNALTKLPMLKLGEYEMWEIRIKQYFQIQDYALWEVIENGNSWVPIPVTAPESGPSTALKMTLTFNQYVDAQSMFAAIKARFGGNEATKRTQKALLKQQYRKNFNASSSESLDSIFNRLQKLVSRLAILGVVTPPEDLNVKFLRSYFCVDTYADSTGTTKVNTASTETSTASFSDATVYTFLSTQPQGSDLVHKDLEQLHDDDLEEIELKWNMALLSMRARKFYQRTGRKIIIDGSSTAGYDKSKAVRIEDASEKAMCAIDGPGLDWSDMVENEIQSNMALMAFTDSEVSNDKSCSKSCLKNYEALKKQYDDLLVKLDDTGFKAATYKRGLSILEAQVVKYKESEVLFSEEIALLKRSVGHKEYLMGLLKTKLEKVKEEKEGFEFKIAKFEKSSKDLDDLLASQFFKSQPLFCDRESDNSKENTDDSLKQQHKTVTETSSVKSPLKVDKDWKEKFFYPANHVREEEPKKARENNDAPFHWKIGCQMMRTEVEPNPRGSVKQEIGIKSQGYRRTDIVMSDSDESGITYTAVSSPFEDLSDIGSPRADDHEYLELPYIPEDPYLEAALQAPPSPDYVPGPEEPEQAPLSPDYVPGPEYADDEIVAEDQPGAEDAPPTAQSPDYVPDTDPEADPEEDDDEDPEEDPIDYPADGGDDGDDEMDIEEDEDDDMDIDADEEDEDDEMDVEVDEEAEEEHPAPAYPVVVALPATAPSAEETEPFETDESAATPPPHPAYRMTARITIPEPLPVPAWSDSEVARLLAISSPPASPLSPWSSSPPQIPFPLSPPTCIDSTPS
ncbi:hypothetical protein Tco_0511065 [Tanacetum coccineum]